MMKIGWDATVMRASGGIVVDVDGSPPGDDDSAGGDEGRWTTMKAMAGVFDGADNDQDGLFDCDDPGWCGPSDCATPDDDADADDADESDADVDVDDGADDDVDGDDDGTVDDFEGDEGRWTVSTMTKMGMSTAMTWCLAADACTGTTDGDSDGGVDEFEGDEEGECSDDADNDRVVCSIARSWLPTPKCGGGPQIPPQAVRRARYRRARR